MSMVSQVTSSLVRHFPRSSVRASSRRYAHNAAFNERFSFQVVFRHKEDDPQTVRLVAEAPPALSVRTLSLYLKMN